VHARHLPQVVQFGGKTRVTLRGGEQIWLEPDVDNNCGGELPSIWRIDTEQGPVGAQPLCLKR
jgi:hypothetical protein